MFLCLLPREPSRLGAQRDAARVREETNSKSSQNSSASPAAVFAPKAEPGNAAHVGAPMPGAISRVFVSPGQAINADDVLVSTEAMKVETAIHAEENGTIAEVLVKAGDQIDAKDLLVTIAAGSA
jgi:pyruvate carboxylase